MYYSPRLWSINCELPDENTEVLSASAASDKLELPPTTETSEWTRIK